MKSRYVKPMLALLAVLGVGLALAVTPAATAPLILDWQVIGTGGPTMSGGTCTGVGGVPPCTLSPAGEALGKHVGSSTYHLSVLALTAAGFNASGGFCSFANGTGDVIAADGSEIHFSTVGLLCREAGAFSPFHYNGTYRIDPGPSTMRFDEAVGGGNLALTLESGTVNFIKIDGTINF